MLPIRSFLFVPATRPTWIDKAIAAGADAIILDLEDSVPADQKDVAREQAAAEIAERAGSGVRLYVRINVGVDGPSIADIEAVCREGLEGILQPKVTGPEDVEAAHLLIGQAERGAGLKEGTVGIVATLETARGLQLAYECALHERVWALIGATAKNADVARSVGFRWTPGGVETLFLRSRVVVAARAAGKLPIGGLWQQFRDVEGMRRSAAANRDLGMTGEIAIHPASVSVLNETYSPSSEEIRYFEGMISAYETAVKAGQSALVYEGEHIDLAHVKTAREILAVARRTSPTSR